MKLKKLSAIIAALILSVSAHAGMVGFSLDQYTVSAGDVFSVDVVAKYFTKNLVGGTVSLNYDSTVIRLAEKTDLPTGENDVINFSSYWPTTQLGNLKKKNKLEHISFFATGVEPKGDFNLFKVWFVAENNGNTKLSLSPWDMNPFANTDAEVVNVKFNDANVSVIPLPASAWLFVSALSFLGLKKQRKC